MKLMKMLIKFLIVGISGVGINIFIYSILIYLGINYLLAASISFLFAVSNNFYWNFMWTFKGRAMHKSVRRKYIKFFLVSCFNFLINIGVLKYLVFIVDENKLLGDFLFNILKILNLDNGHIVKILCQIMAIGVATIFNFFGNYYITFKEKQEEKK